MALLPLEVFFPLPPVFLGFFEAMALLFAEAIEDTLSAFEIAGIFDPW